ncbi:uncharacterized protein LOC143018739 [Oratosquilla oratoria]|uniref:uncharacterized protein LOC143018739 n=1 Tax=Oratosquilla oratoria TaxID=337810 RepID=UPI003F7739D3
MSARKSLLLEQIDQKQQLLSSLNEELGKVMELFHNCSFASHLRDEIERALHHSLSMHANATESRVQKKLSRLYGEEKTAELELLYRNLCELHKKGKIDMNPDIKELLQAESTKHRAHGRSSLLTAELRQAAKELRENNDIVIRRADKSDLFVILNRSEYIDKVDSILQDPSKFLRLKKNPIDEILKKVTKLIDNANADRDGVKFSLCKVIMNLDEFVDLLRNTNPQGILASLDVESLFTNVNVEDTIKIILQNVFNHDSLPPPKIPRLTLENMLRTCTKEVPFRCPSGKIYFQTDGVAMGSPLGVLFAQAYMCHLENHVLNTLSQKPNMYLRYIDDIFTIEASLQNALRLIRFTIVFEKDCVVVK